MQPHKQMHFYKCWPVGQDKDTCGVDIEAEYSYVALTQYIAQKGIKDPDIRPPKIAVHRQFATKPKIYGVTYKTTVVCGTLTRVDQNGQRETCNNVMADEYFEKRSLEDG